MSEPAHEVVTEHAHRTDGPYEVSASYEAVEGAVAKRAVTAFFSLLDKGKDLRASATELYVAYNLQRVARGWPELNRTSFGRRASQAVKAAGGSKIKSGGQIYVGVGVPSPWQGRCA
jgi:hypothetical protein